MSRPTKAQALDRLHRSLDSIPELKQMQIEMQQLPGFRKPGSFPPKFRKWFRDTQVAIVNTFGPKSGHVEQFQGINYRLNLFSALISDWEHQRAYIGGLNSAAAVLESMIDEITEYWDENESASEADILQASTTSKVTTNRVFLVHGRDEESKESVARYIQNLGLDPVILSELPARGQTIIEKFESNSDVEFAVALLTSDDAGALDGETELKPRARQNVVFELGFFIGKLGRHKVCVLTKGNPEIPSDYAGVEYIPIDAAGAWKMRLMGELKVAEFDVDANRVFPA